MTRNDGGNWTERSAGLPNYYIRSICPSRFQESRVYLAMTGGQVTLSLGGDTGPATGVGQVEQIRRIAEDRPRLRVIRADSEETAQHLARLEAIAKALGGASVWEQLDNKPDC